METSTELVKRIYDRLQRLDKMLCGFNSSQPLELDLDYLDVHRESRGFSQKNSTNYYTVRYWCSVDQCWKDFLKVHKGDYYVISFAYPSTEISDMLIYIKEQLDVKIKEQQDILERSFNIIMNSDKE